MKFKKTMKVLGVRLKRASPAILAIVAGAGVVATAILSARATTKATRLIQEKADADGCKVEDLEPVIVVKTAWKSYVPAAVTGTVTIASIFGAHLINKHQQKTLLGAYTALGMAFNKYRAQANALYGEDADEKIQEAVKEQDKEESDVETIHTFIDCYRDEPYEKTWSDVLAAEYNTNYQLQRDGYVSLNDFYKWLELEPLSGGDDVGWSLDTLLEEIGLCWVPFINNAYTLNEGMQMVSIDVAVAPSKEYLGFE